MIKNIETIVEAYIALAKKTLSQDVNTLNDINQHLKAQDSAADVNNGK